MGSCQGCDKEGCPCVFANPYEEPVKVPRVRLKDKLCRIQGLVNLFGLIDYKQVLDFTERPLFDLVSTINEMIDEVEEGL